MFQVTFFFISFIRSTSLRIKSHDPSAVGPGNNRLIFTWGSWQLHHVTSLGRGIISCTALDRSFGVWPPDTFITESSRTVAPGASLGKLFLVRIYADASENQCHTGGGGGGALSPLMDLMIYLAGKKISKNITLKGGATQKYQTHKIKL